MQFTLSTTIALLAIAGTGAFQLPGDHPDGTFKVSLDGNGRRSGEITPIQLLEDIENRTTSSSSEPPHLAARKDIPESHIGCYNNEYLDGVNFEQAIRMFKTEQCKGDGSIGGRSAIVTKVGSTAVYACSSGASNSCDGDELDEAFRRIQRQCGGMGLGWLNMDPWRKTYGRALSGSKICEWASGGQDGSG
ncbi:hypothetical protein F4778DRAFT_787614 [Xylariomycetidae sp. FL2044]|nr:hypothetical protein F4778DRAFT_787614 [Xylariomycetidae sp. FL2044]